MLIIKQLIIEKWILFHLLVSSKTILNLKLYSKTFMRYRCPMYNLFIFQLCEAWRDSNNIGHQLWCKLSQWYTDRVHHKLTLQVWESQHRSGSGRQWNSQAGNTPSPQNHPLPPKKMPVDIVWVLEYGQLCLIIGILI